LALTFDENVQIGAGEIRVRKSSDGSVWETIDGSSDRVSISGALATIDLTNTLPAETSFYIEVDGGLFQDGIGHGSAELTDPAAWRFTTQTAPSPSWTNPVDPCDVNGDGRVDPTDIVPLVNDINAYGSRQLPPAPDQPFAFLDPSGDGRISPADVALMTNHINALTKANGGGEAEAVDLAFGDTVAAISKGPALQVERSEEPADRSMIIRAIYPSARRPTANSTQPRGAGRVADANRPTARTPSLPFPASLHAGRSNRGKEPTAARLMHRDAYLATAAALPESSADFRVDALDDLLSELCDDVADAWRWTGEK
jgi:hypothetical protein